VHPELAQVLPIASDGKAFLLTEAGQPFTPNGFYMRFREWVRATGLPDGRSPHGLRKAAARRLAEGGCSPHQIAAITGHQTLKEVERYTKDTDQLRMAREAVLHLGRGSGGTPSVKPPAAECQTGQQPSEKSFNLGESGVP
jgi:integrase